MRSAASNIVIHYFKNNQYRKSVPEKILSWRIQVNLDVKYTNPARGILDFCRQKFCRPLLSSPWTLYTMLSSDYIAQHT